MDAQRAKLQAYAVAMDLDLVQIVTDEGRSAKSLQRRGLQMALTLLTSGQADALLVTKLDRLTRSVKDLGFLVERYFADGQYSLLSVGDAITPTVGCVCERKLLPFRVAGTIPSSIENHTDRATK